MATTKKQVKKTPTAKKATCKSKTDVVLSLLRRPNGVRREQCLSMVEWPSIFVSGCCQGRRRQAEIGQGSGQANRLPVYRAV
jgi:hypothetical protein